MLTKPALQTDTKRRALISASASASASAIALASPVWVKPMVNAMILPAHAQTSICLTDSTVGGPLTGHPSGATNCQVACEAEAADVGAQLCAVTETTTNNGIDCGCDLDLP